MTFNEKLVKLRKLRGITQDEFASAVGVSRQAVYKWESGQSYPEVSKLIEIKNLFNISIDDLLDENYEVILPEKKKRLSSNQKRAIENMVKKEEGIVAPEEVIEEAPAKVEEPVTVSAKVEEATPAMAEPETFKAEDDDKEEGEKRGFFKRLFGR
jgi:transcriptional regulator with XRE-family HTH domain